MSWRVPLTSIAMPEEDIEAVLDCLGSGWLTMGPRTLAFEEALAGYLGTRHAVALSSCTAALHLACVAAGIGRGDEVIVPGLTFVSTANAARYVGAEPILCEVRGPDDFNIDVEDVERRITPKTKAVIAVHFCGYPAPVTELRDLCEARGLVLIEDSAQAIGARIGESGRRTGTVGQLGCFSLFSKNQLCVGEGGVVATDDDALAERVRSLRAHAMTSVTWDRHRGYAESYDVTDIGFNFRLDEPRAALGLSRLTRLDRDIAARRGVARAYRQRLAGVHGVELVWDDTAVERSSHFAFPVLLRGRQARDAFRSALAERGVQTTWYPALHELSYYQERDPELSLPRVESVAERHCALPMSPSLSEDDIDAVVDACDAAIGEHGDVLA